MKRNEYIILDNKCGGYKKRFGNDNEAVAYFIKYWKDYISLDYWKEYISLVSSGFSFDEISIYKPDGNLLATAYISTGEIEVIYNE